MTTCKSPSVWTALTSFAAACTLVAAPASGAINFFTNQATWLAAVPGGPSFSENFSGFAADTPFHSAPVALNGMTISREGPEQGLSNYIDVPPLVFSGGSGTAQAELFTNTNEGANIGTQVRIAFVAANKALGFNSWEAVGLEGSVLEVYNGATLLGSQNLGGASAAFLGYVLTGGDVATSVRFRSNLLIVGTSGEGFAIDNLAGVAVPEPWGAALASLCLAGISTCERRRACGANGTCSRAPSV
jgi:hypothetical protein